jgi:hypothetical protein
VRGPLVLSLEIDQAGRVESIRPLLDRLVSDADVDHVRSAVAERLRAVRFSAMPGRTRANVPLIF